MEVRGFTIAFAKRKAKNKRDEEKKLQAQLNELIHNYVYIYKLFKCD